MSSTIDNFQGSSSDYISYLERTVISLRRRQNHCRCSSITHDTLQRDTGTHCPTTSGTKELEIVHFHPTKSPTRATTRKRRKKETPVPRWEEQALTLIGETPKADMWTHKLKEIGIFDVMCSGKAVSHLLLLDVGNKPRTVSPGDTSMAQVLRSSPLSRIEHYASVSVQKEITAAVATALANYQKFLVLSSCAVLVRIGTSTKEIYDIVRICMGNAVTDDHCKRILRACQFVHELMDTLYMGGWGLRAFELLLVCESPNSSTGNVPK